jgi:hypothetical protein
MHAVIRRTLAGLAALATTVGLLVAAAPAQAAPHALEFSTDGVTWSATPLGSIFGTDFRYVPGDTESSTIYVRNVRAVPTSVMMAITDVTYDDTEFGTALSIAATDFASGGLPETSIGAVPACTVIAPRRDLGPGESFGVRLDIAVATWLTDGHGQSSSANFSLVVGMADRDTPIAANSCLNAAASIPAFGNGGRIASTGADEPYAALSFAGFALGAGCVLIVMVRRRRRKTTV